MESLFSNKLFLLASWVVLAFSLFETLTGEQAAVQALIVVSYLYWASILKQGGTRARHQLKSFGISNVLLLLFHLATGFVCVVAVLKSIIFNSTGLPYLQLLFLPAIGLPIIAFQHQIEDFES